MNETKLKSIEPLMQLILLDISNLRTHWAKLMKECPEVTEGVICDHWDYFRTDDILERMEDDIKAVLGEAK